MYAARKTAPSSSAIITIAIMAPIPAPATKHYCMKRTVWIDNEVKQ